MAQYVLQFYNQTNTDPSKPPGRLIKNYQVTEEAPIRPAEDVPSNRDQMIIEDDDLYSEIVEAYNNYPGDPANLIFTYDLEAKTVTW